MRIQLFGARLRHKDAPLLVRVSYPVGALSHPRTTQRTMHANATTDESIGDSMLARRPRRMTRERGIHAEWCNGDTNVYTYLRA